jgi:hypothetical protein
LQSEIQLLGVGCSRVQERGDTACARKKPRKGKRGGALRERERGALRLTVWKMARTEEMETHISRELIGTGVLN